MSTMDYTTRLLGLEDAEIKELRENDQEVQIEFRLPRCEQACPACGAKTQKIHDYRYRKIRNLDIVGRRLTLIYERRRYACQECGKRFSEKCSFVGKYQRISMRHTMKIAEMLRHRISVKKIAECTSSSISSVQRILSCMAFPRPNLLPTAISFDEFKGNAGGEKFQCIITDAINHKVLDILPERTSAVLQEYLMKFPNRESVRYAVIDMNCGFLNVIKTLLPNAKIIIDRFHVVRYCTAALENVRRNLQKQLPDHQRKYFKRSRRLLLAHQESLSPENRTAVEAMLNISDRLKQAYALKEYFYFFMESKNREEAVTRLDHWLNSCHLLDLPEFDDCVRMLKNWRHYILNAFDYHLSNGFTEGCNNAIKSLKRVAFGFRSFNNFRVRILLSFYPNY